MKTLPWCFNLEAATGVRKGRRFSFIRELARHSQIGFILAFVCVLRAGPLESQSSGKPDVITAEEYAVYASAMDEMVGGPWYVVMDRTDIQGKPADPRSAFNFPIKDANHITKELVNDFVSKNRGSHAIAQQFPAGVRVVLITESERDRMFSGCLGEIKCGWKTFYDKYPDAPGITTLSRVGFNQKRDTALMYISNVRDWKVGIGMYLLLAKANGTWTVIGKTLGWIS